ncbi:MAG: hypothetical protein M0R17_03675 [Candidatus Omnitrophica bacterium]|jgi:hypothetical protein|nr:hypothetical protein [Candidatus Omnitrophota bacterium]
MSRIITVGLEYYEDNNNDTQDVDGVHYTIPHGIVITKVKIIKAPNDELNGAVDELVAHIITGFMHSTSEYLKKTYPKACLVMATKQFWFHATDENFIANNQIKKADPIFKDPSFEENINPDLNESNVIDMFDRFYDKDGEVLFSIPDKIDFWDNI